MTTFREYRESLARGQAPEVQAPDLPSDAIPFQGERAGFVSRAIAAGIDVAIVVLVVLGSAGVLWVLLVIFDPTTAPGTGASTQVSLPDLGVFILYGYLLNVLYWTVGWATGGRTIGNLIMGLRVVNRRGRKVGWGGALVRALFCTLFIPGLFWVIISGANRSVQDVVLRTSVIYDWVIGIPGLTRKAAPGPGAPSDS